MSTGDTKTRINSIEKIDYASEEINCRSNEPFARTGYASQTNLRQSGKINSNILPPKSTMQKQYLASNGHIEYKQTPLHRPFGNKSMKNRHNAANAHL